MITPYFAVRRRCKQFHQRAHDHFTIYRQQIFGSSCRPSIAKGKNIAQFPLFSFKYCNRHLPSFDFNLLIFLIFLIFWYPGNVSVVFQCFLLWTLKFKLETKYLFTGVAIVNYWVQVVSYWRNIILQLILCTFLNCKKEIRLVFPN